MIKVDRNKFPLPDIYMSVEYARLKEELKHFAPGVPSSFRQNIFTNPRALNFNREIKTALRAVFNRKCACCESITEEGVVDRFRPKQNARNLDKTVDPECYFWLAFEWENLYYTCTTCQRNKGNWFPVNGPRIRYNEDPGYVINEDYLLIDPCRDDPREHLSYNSDGTTVPLTKKGAITIDILKLNRDYLVLRRQKCYNEQIDILHRYAEASGSELARLDDEIGKILRVESDNEHLAIRRHAINEYGWTESGQLAIARADRLLQHETSVSLSKTKNGSKKKGVITRARKAVKNSYVTEIKINNFKSIRNFSIKIKDNVSEENLAPWTVLLGENGTGKSSVLQAIALSLIDESYINKLVKPEHILSYNPYRGQVPTSGSVSVKTDQSEVYSIEFSKHSRKISKTNDSIPNYVLGYGSTRLSQQNKLSLEKESRYYKVANLFNHTVAIRNAEKWLLSLPRGNAFRSASATIKRGLGLTDDYQLVRRQKKVYVSRKGKEVSLEHMSDGYRSTISLLVDIMASLVKKMDNFEGIEGIVFIDELELHLHPKWKMRFIKSFRAAFPKIQVFASTHDPLCLKGLFDGEVVLLRETSKNTVKCFTELPNVTGMRADQLLTSEFFGLGSTVDPEYDENYRRYYYLLSKTKLTNPEKIELEGLKKFVMNSQQFGDSLRDELWMTAIDELVAKQFLGNRLLDRTAELKPETIKVLKDMLDK